MNKQENNETADFERLIHGYDRLSHRAEQILGSSATHSRDIMKKALEAAREKAIELGELTHEEATRVHEFVTQKPGSDCSFPIYRTLTI